MQFDPKSEANKSKEKIILFLPSKSVVACMAKCTNAIDLVSLASVLNSHWTGTHLHSVTQMLSN